MTLEPPKAQDAADLSWSALPPEVRVVRSIAPTSQVRVLMANFTPEETETAAFGALYHCRWRFEEPSDD